MIPRRIQPTLLDLARTFPVITVTGPRQSGKTTLCRMAFPHKRYVSLEDPDDRRFAMADPRGFLRDLRDGAVLDEVQRTPELLSYLQGMVDEDPSPGRFVLTGSSNLALGSGVTQTLAGRTGLLELLPLDVDERCELAPVDDPWQAVWEGGYPAIHDRRVPADRWLGAYASTYVERDVRQVLAVGDLVAFQSFVELAATWTGNLVNLSALGAGVGVSHVTARSWLSALEASYLVHRTTPLLRNLGKRVVKAPKIHFLDTGLACWLLGIRSPDELRRHPLRGALLESWVVSEARKALANRGVRAHLHHWRDPRGREVDLVVDRGQDLLAVEVKAGETLHPSFFDGLERFAALAREAVPPPPDGVRAVLIYTGDRRQARSAGLALPWREVQAAGFAREGA
ncbi:MAG: ATP-binding protein [Deltaproteobacteria bacterium]|nr:ATP-binding protein [Deltaproteobacteria bacterium]